MTIGMWLGEATRELIESGIDSARLDAEIILAHTLKHHPKTYLHAHLDEQIDPRSKEIANARLDLRLDRVPIAYIIGHKEFYGRRFYVTPSVLIPRPESEEIIELLKEVLSQQSLIDTSEKKLVDIGAGSGCLGITAKLEFPELDVTLVDTSNPALTVARKNAKSLGADVDIMQSNLLTNYPYSPNIVLANLPYVDASWTVSPETTYEPHDALFARENGLKIIHECLTQLSTRMRPGCIIILEADPRQWKDILAFAKQYGFQPITAREFAASFRKV